VGAAKQWDVQLGGVTRSQVWSFLSPPSFGASYEKGQDSCPSSLRPLVAAPRGDVDGKERRESMSAGTRDSVWVGPGPALLRTWDN